jgi:hypothetical protein
MAALLKTNTFESSVPAESRTAAQRAFFGALALATAVPLIWLGFGVQLFHQNTASITAAILPVLVLTGVGHVAATAFFYFDRDLSELIRQNRQRFFLWPTLAALGCLTAFFASGPAWTAVLTGFLAWQLYHYQRQNYGLIAFAAQSTGAEKLPAELNLDAQPRSRGGGHGGGVRLAAGMCLQHRAVCRFDLDTVQNTAGAHWPG